MAATGGEATVRKREDWVANNLLHRERMEGEALLRKKMLVHDTCS